MRTIRQNYKIILTITASVIFFLLPVGWASSPGWDDIPDHLKKESGVERAGDWVFIIGTARTENIRADKAHELARKKSMHHALQIVRMESGCHGLINNLSQEDQKIALQIFAPLLMPSQLSGITVVRQWNELDNHFTALAAPAALLAEGPCPFLGITDAISKYIEQGSASLAGLEFCLRHAPRHSGIARIIQNKIAEYYQLNKQYALSLCFLPINPAGLLSPLTLQMRIDQSREETEIAAQLIRKKKWETALEHLNSALINEPAYAPAYPLLGNYLLDEKNKPVLTRYAAEKTLQSGTQLFEGLSLMTRSLKALDSSEAQVYFYILAQTKNAGGKDYPAKIEKTHFPGIGLDLPNLVLNSLGNAIMGNPKPAGPEYKKASQSFNAAKNDADIKKTLSLLFQSCEKQPYTPETYNLIGACFRNLNQPLHALPFLWAALSLRPDYDLALTNLGLCCQKLRLRQSAGYYFEYPAVKNSTNQWVRESYAQFKKN